MLERMWIKEIPLTLLVGMQVGTATLENSMEVPHKVKNRATLGIYTKDTDVVKRSAICTAMFIAALSTIPKLWKDRDALQQMTGLRRCGPYIQWNITQPSERMITQHLQQHGQDWRR